MNKISGWFGLVIVLLSAVSMLGGCRGGSRVAGIEASLIESPAFPADTLRTHGNDGAATDGPLKGNGGVHPEAHE